MRIALASCRDLPDWEVDDRPLHAELAERGISVVLPAWDDPAVDWAALDGVLIRTTWDYVPRHRDFLAWADSVAQRTRLWNGPDTVRWNLDKRYLRDLERAGVSTVPTVWLDRGQAPSAAVLTGRGWARAFLKPAIGASAVGTLRFDVDESGLAAAAALVAAADVPHLVQPYLGRVERDGERSAIVIDGGVSHCVRKVPVPGDYRVQDDYGAHDEPYTPSAAEWVLVTAAQDALDALGVLSLVHRIDWLLDDAGRPCLNELEAIEPSLFFRHAPGAAARLADALERRLRT